MRMFMAVAAAALVATPLAADDHSTDLTEVLEHERRDGDRARDVYRNPAETLAFFGVEADMTVAELMPGGGWYTRVLAPYTLAHGQYIAINGDSEGIAYPNRAIEARAKAWTESFKERFSKEYGVEADTVQAYEIDEFPEEMDGTVDRLLIIRGMHGPWSRGELPMMLGEMRAMLKDDGMIGIVQHRAPADAAYDDVYPPKGYLREADVIKMMEIHGFELVKSSEINANPRDTADHPNGVWEMKPVWSTKRPELANLGESDRMTLLFKKAD